MTRIIPIDDILFNRWVRMDLIKDFKQSLECYAYDCDESPQYYIDDPEFGHVLACVTHKIKYWGGIKIHKTYEMTGKHK